MNDRTKSASLPSSLPPSLVMRPLSFVLCRSLWARANAQVDAIAVAITILTDLLVFDAAAPFERIVHVAAADAPALGFPCAAHEHSLPGNHGGAVGQMHGAQHLAGKRAIFR